MASLRVIDAEIRMFFVQARSLIAVPVLLASAFVSLWPYISNWFIPVIIGTFIILEPSFNNILFRSPREFELLAIAPVRWTTVVASKNCGTIMLAVAVTLSLGVPTAYMLLDPPTFGETIQAGEIFLATLFPMIMAGNVRSVQTPRRRVGASLADAAETVITIVILGVVSLPYLFIKAISDVWWIIPLYVVLNVALWIGVSIPATARAVERHRSRLCLTE